MKHCKVYIYEKHHEGNEYTLMEFDSLMEMHEYINDTLDKEDPNIEWIAKFYDSEPRYGGWFVYDEYNWTEPYWKKHEQKENSGNI